MRIAFIDMVVDPAKPGQGGLSDLVWDMARRLARTGDRVHVVAPYTSPSVPDPAVQVHRYPIPPIGYRNVVGHVAIALRAHRELSRLEVPDVIHTPEYLSAAICASLQRQVPLVLTEPGNIFERIVSGNPYDRFTTLAYKVAARVAARRCQQVIATSDWMMRWWHWTGVPPDRMNLVPLGVDTSLFQPTPGARAMLGLSGSSPIILCAARLSRENGLDVAIEAAARILKEMPNCRVHVVGDGPERDNLRRLAGQLGIGDSITWHGWVGLSELPPLYSSADLFVFAGRSGGTPRVLLQAMACGAPVLASRIGGIVDHVSHNKTGLLFSPRSVDGLAAEALRALADPELRLALGSNAREYARSTLDWDVLISRIRAVYLRAVGRAA